MRKFIEKTILVVEDEPLNRKLLSDILTQWGAVVIEAGNGREDVGLAIGKTPDLILMDMQLPVLDGMETTRLIKANPATRHIPIVALTGYAMDGDDKRIHEAGCDGYL